MPGGTDTEVRGFGVRFQAVAERADRGEVLAVRAIRTLVNELPDVWEGCGNVATAAEDALVDLHAGGSALAREALRKKLRDMRAALAGPTPLPLEQLLVERVVMCWLHSYQADLAYARAVGELPPQVADLYQRRQDRAARQYLKAMRSLADVRRLLIPVLQLNVAENQVNLAVASPAAQRDRTAAGQSSRARYGSRTTPLRPPRPGEPA